jgi:hypothetical protein
MAQGLKNSEPGAEALRNAGGHLIRGIFAYLALTPAIFCFGLLLLITFIISLQGFQQETAGIVEMILASLANLAKHYPLLKSFVPDFSGVISDSGIIEINNSNLQSVIFKLYGLMALPFVLLGLVTDVIRGPRPPRALAKKIKILALATLAVIVILFANLLFGSGSWGGSVLVWSLMFTIGPGLVFLISSLSLYLHHIILTTSLETSV